MRLSFDSSVVNKTKPSLPDLAVKDLAYHYSAYNTVLSASGMFTGYAFKFLRTHYYYFLQFE